jgi:hypothetical protein
MGLYFKGRVVSDESIVKRLGNGEYKAIHIGNRIWIWESQRNRKTIITGDEGNGELTIIAEGDNKEEAMAKLKVKREKNEVFAEWVQRILKKYPDAT